MASSAQLSYQDALANLNKGGLTGSTLASAQSNLKNYYAASPGATSPTPTSITTPQSTPGQNSTSSMAAQPKNTSYDKALSSYLDTLKGSNQANDNADRAAITARRGYLDTLDAPGGLKSGAQETAALFNRNSSANLADLGVAQNAATNASNVALERLKYEQGQLPKPGEAFNLSPGQARYDASGKQIAALADNPSVSEKYGSGAVGEYNYAKDNGYTGTFSQYQNEDANRKAIIAKGGSSSTSSLKSSTTSSKGTLGSKQFVELSLQRAGIKYDQALKQIPQGKVGVINNSTGEIGYINPTEYNTKQYTYL